MISAMEMTRSALSLAFARRIVDIPHFDLILRPNLYSSQNERNDGPYYSPLRDFSGSVGLDAQHVIWRKYGRSFGHRLVVTCGEYWQEGFGAGWIGSVGYEQVYQNSPWTEIRYGVQGSRRIYDGDVVPSIDFFIRFDVRF
jgi:biofilm PGA synthesis protein PgaA